MSSRRENLLWHVERCNERLAEIDAESKEDHRKYPALDGFHHTVYRRQRDEVLKQRDCFYEALRKLGDDD